MQQGEVEKTKQKQKQKEINKHGLWNLTNWNFISYKGKLTKKYNPKDHAFW